MKQILSLVAILLLFGCRPQTEKAIGLIRDGVYLLEKPCRDSLTTKWDSLLQGHDLHAEITDITVIDTRDAADGRYFPALVGKTGNDSVNVALALRIENGKLYFDMGRNPETVICHGTPGCRPEMRSGEWSCTSGQGGECHKISTIEVAY